MKRIYGIIFTTLALTFLSSTRLPAPASARSNATAVCGTLPANATWTAANSPYDVCATGITIPFGVVITINSGVTVQFEPGIGDKLTVLGTLTALGTQAQPVVFTGVTASPGSWAGISTDGAPGAIAHLSLDYVSLEYGGISGSFGAQVYADRAVVNIDHSLVRNSAGNGFYATQNTQFDLKNTAFTGNAKNAIQLNQPSGDLLLSGLTASGNGTDGVRLPVASPMPGKRHWLNPGIPYMIDGVVGNSPGDSLTLEPGVELQFSTAGFMSIAGSLSSVGTDTQPITFTAQTRSPGGWRGLLINGGIDPALAQFDYAIIEYGGSDVNGANIQLSNAQLVAHHTRIRASSKDGVRIDSNSSASLVDGEVSGNTLYGVRNLQPNRAVLATNNWWGDPGGPQSDLTLCSSGHGDKVTAGVLFVPVIASQGAVSPYPLSDAPALSISPRRWFAPADGQTRVYFDISLRDGNGMPLPRRTVKLNTNLGAVVDGGITNSEGKTLAYLTSTSTGDANVSASLDALSSCEGVLSPTSKVTFAPPVNLTDLLPNAPASYFDGDITVDPLPLITGITATISVRLTNPLTIPVTVDVSFDFAQAGVGLVFGPIKDITGKVIPGRSSVTLTAGFVPVVAGHYCVQVGYNITAVGSVVLKAPLSGGRQLKQFNWDAKQAPPISPQSKDSLNKADKAFNLVSKLPSGPTQIQKAVVGGWWGWVKKTASKISQSLGFDPPRQDYTTVTQPVRHPFASVQPGANISDQRVAALNAVSAALTDVEAYGTAATTALDRYGGASAAGNLTWASLQSNEMLYYQHQFGSALLAYADSLDAFVTILKTEGETQTVITTSDVIAYQNRLSSSGFTPQEISDAHQAGLSDADIEAFRQEIIATDPASIAGDLLDIYTQEAAVARDTGNAILNPNIFAAGYRVGGSAGFAPSASTGNVMAQAFNTTETIQMGNPLTQTETIQAHIRRIDLPADWGVSLTPAQATLAPNATTTLTVSIAPGSPIPQGSHLRLAVEGFAGSQLLGGVVIEIIVPRYLPFDGSLHIFAPMIRK